MKHFFSTLFMMLLLFISVQVFFPDLVSSASQPKNSDVIKSIQQGEAGFSLSNFSLNTGSGNNVRNIINSIINIILKLIYMVMLPLCMFLFFLGIAKYVYNANNEEARANGRNYMIWSVIAIAVVASIWGLSYFLIDQFGIVNAGKPLIPQLLPLKTQNQ